ncbi:subtilisin-like protein [Auriculariales sp. MPI-PUGE-AT-0066]|nr:subtilisin-like protein [Auriculariales sp. MPI-PUGE-AT-0066]
MQLSVLAVTIALAVFTLAAGPTSLKYSAHYPHYAEGKVLVELQPNSALRKRDVHARFLDELDRRLPYSSMSVHKMFDHTLFTGVSLVVKSLDDLETIKGLTGVVDVHPVRILSTPKFDTTDPPKFAFTPGDYPPLVQTGVNKIHARGNKGKGINIGVYVLLFPVGECLGVDWTHPALGGCFGPGCKIAGGWDFVGDAYDAGMTGDPAGATPVPDPDPQDCFGHGTHVSGIIGADPAKNPYNITGVAYEATLRMYRIMGCLGVTSDDVIVEALLRAYDEGNDVITLSLGEWDGWTTSITSVVASRISRKGRVVTVAAGNSGDSGLWFTSGPAAGVDVIAIGSTNNIGPGPLFKMETSLGQSIPYQRGGSALPLPAPAAPLTLFAVLVRLGNCAATSQIQNVLNKGAKVVILYNNGGIWGPIPMGALQDQAVFIDTDDGLALLGAVNAHKNFTVSFPDDNSSIVPNVKTGGLVSAFSSYGPTFDMYMKPAVSTPGGVILSTVPLFIFSGYAFASGTSMATPHAAGIAALILKAKGKGYATNIRDLLQTTSTVIPQSYAPEAFVNTLAAGGAGQASALNALTYTTVVTPGQLLLNDTAHWKGVQKFTITNGGTTSRTYVLKHVPAGTAASRARGSIQPLGGPVPLSSAPVTVRLSKSRVDLRPGQSLPIIATFTPPRSIDPSTIPIVSGHIEIATQGETLKVSYLGVAADLRSVQVVDDTPQVLGVVSPFLQDAASGSVQSGPATYTFVNNNSPVLNVRIVFGTARLAIDLVSATAHIPTNIHKRGPSSSSSSFAGWVGSWFPHFRSHGGSYARVPVLGSLDEWTYLPRNNNNPDENIVYQVPIAASFANGTAVPKGAYKILARVLREDYEVWVSPVVNFAPGA